MWYVYLQWRSQFSYIIDFPSCRMKSMVIQCVLWFNILALVFTSPARVITIISTLYFYSKKAAVIHNLRFMLNVVYCHWLDYNVKMTRRPIIGYDMTRKYYQAGSKYGIIQKYHSSPLYERKQLKMHKIKLFYDTLSQPSRALKLFLAVNKIPHEAVMVNLAQGKQQV